MKQKYQVNLKSSTAPVSVYLVNRPIDAAEPTDEPNSKNKLPDNEPTNTNTDENSDSSKTPSLFNTVPTNADDEKSKSESTKPGKVHIKSQTTRNDDFL